MKKIIFITNIISPYRIHFFNELEKFKNVLIKVLYIAKTEINRQWDIRTDEINYDYEIINGLHIPSGNNRINHINFNYLRKIESFNPSTIILGTDLLSSSISFRIIRYARKNKIQLIRYEGQHNLKSNKLVSKYSLLNSLKSFLYKKRSIHDGWNIRYNKKGYSS